MCKSSTGALHCKRGKGCRDIKKIEHVMDNSQQVYRVCVHFITAVGFSSTPVQFQLQKLKDSRCLTLYQDRSFTVKKALTRSGSVAGNGTKLLLPAQWVVLLSPLMKTWTFVPNNVLFHRSVIAKYFLIFQKRFLERNLLIWYQLVEIRNVTEGS